jgi:predicted glycosyltransferase
MSLTVLIAVTHLLGAGHLTRAAALARAFSSSGHRVALISGGMPSAIIRQEGFDLVQLPPVRIEGTDFRSLLDEQGSPVDGAYLARRRALILGTLEDMQPDVVVTELFPFGRRVLAGEFLSLIETARSLPRRPIISCSIRDILVAPSQQERVLQAHERLKRYYDAVFAHGDRRLAPLEASWPLDPSLSSLVHETGYVDEGEKPPAVDARSGIIVSGGSSAASLPLYQAAIDAARLLPDLSWRILVGRGVDENAFEALRRRAGPAALVERARPDFRACLARSAVSVSQCGYNTAVDILATETPAVFVPFEAGNESEQRLRAERLQSMGLAHVVSEAELSGERISSAVVAAMAAPRAPRPSIALDGAARTVALTEALVSRPRSRTNNIFQPVLDALSAAHDRGKTVSFWWRDDDAVAPNPALERLIALARRYEAPVALAAIPASAEPELGERVRYEPLLTLLVHGLTHANHAPADEKKAEFGAHRPLNALLRDAETAISRLRRIGGDSLVPIFVPPWNRISSDLVSALPGLGYTGLSTFGPHPAQVADLRVVNTDIDPMDWHGTRSLLEPAAIVSQVAEAVTARSGQLSKEQGPVGLLTHHLVHDEAIWAFLDQLLDTLCQNNVAIQPPAAVFAAVSGSRFTIDAL